MRRRTVVLAAAAAAATVVAVVGGVVAVSDPPPRGAPPTQAEFSTTPLTAYDTTSRVVARESFCDGVDEREVDAALGGEPTATTAWDEGDTVEVSAGVEDVTNEYGCRYAAADGTVAQAWVFAPPVDPTQAQHLTKSAAKGPGCQSADGPPFGSPTVALTCTRDGVQRSSYRGLFGDGWLVCEVIRPGGATWDTVDRAGRWCVAVLEASRA